MIVRILFLLFFVAALTVYGRQIEGAPAAVRPHCMAVSAQAAAAHSFSVNTDEENAAVQAPVASALLSRLRGIRSDIEHDESASRRKPPVALSDRVE